MFKLLKSLVAIIIALAFFATQALPAFACGGLLAPNGAIRLTRATTLVSWHNGIERYFTSFTYQEGNTHAVANLGWIVPLPAVPIKIEEGGGWTLQRLFRETHPQPLRFAEGVASSTAGVQDSAQVLQQVKVEALNITVLRGNGQEIMNWAANNGLLIDADARAHLAVYAQASPIFMAAKYDTTAARARHQLRGDGTPLLITMKTPHLWVPLEVLAIGGQQVNADLYLLTDMPVNTSDLAASLGQSAVGTEVPGAPGFRVAFQEQMPSQLYNDLSTDRNMSWVQPNTWLTYLSLDAPNTAVTYDLGISSTGIIRLAPFGTPPMAVVDRQQSQGLPAWLASLPPGSLPIALTLLVLLSIGGVLFLILCVKTRSQASR